MAVTSKQLEDAKSTLINNATNYIEKLDNLANAFTNTSNTLSSMQDTLLKNEMAGLLNSAAADARNRIGVISGKVNETITAMDTEIKRLREQERLALLRLMQNEEAKKNKEIHKEKS